MLPESWYKKKTKSNNGTRKLAWKKTKSINGTRKLAWKKFMSNNGTRKLDFKAPESWESQEDGCEPP